MGYTYATKEKEMLAHKYGLASTRACLRRLLRSATGTQEGNLHQSFSAKNPATPPLIQDDGSRSVGVSRFKTKLVECPVVIKVPFLLSTL
mmetsp:Transcript_13252/g.33079  ORF Transcript_13252/g.33079 Transcript_13252/m.33079 type:complete len:90 (+) Transcript_13252:197-466(+)